MKHYEKDRYHPIIIIIIIIIIINKLLGVVSYQSFQGNASIQGLPHGERYAAGDVLVVWPRTDPSLVKRFVVDTLEHSLKESVRIRPRSRSFRGRFCLFVCMSLRFSMVNIYLY